MYGYTVYKCNLCELYVCNKLDVKLGFQPAPGFSENLQITLLNWKLSFQDEIVKT